MEQPKPIDLNKLKGILSASKAIMNKVENNNYSVGHIDSRALNEDGVNQLYSEGVTRPVTSAPVEGYTEEQVKNSRLPDAIKKVMLESPIPKLSGPSHTFTLDDVADLQEKPMGYPKTPKATPKTVFNESIQSNSDRISVTREQLKEMVNEIVNERLVELFMKASAQKITEDTVKKTLNGLIKEGKLTAKKKTP